MKTSLETAHGALASISLLVSLVGCPPTAPSEGQPSQSAPEGNDPPDASSADGDDAAPATGVWSTIPASDGASVPAVVRFAWIPAASFAASGATPDHVLVLEGSASDADVAAFASDHPPKSLLDRAAPASVWTDGADPASTLYLQPTRALHPGPATLLVHLPRRAIARWDIEVASSTAPLSRVWPPVGAAAGPSEPWIYCGDATSDLTAASGSVTLAPTGAAMTAQPMSGPPCVSIAPDAPLAAGAYVVPPTLGETAIAIDPAPIDVAASVVAAPTTACLEGEVAFGALCLRVDDDRVLVELHGGSGAAVFGAWSNGTKAPWVSVVSDGHPAVLRGLPALKYVSLSAQIHRPGIVDDPIQGGVLTFAPHPHVIVDEALRKPQSKLPTQRFVELVNDGATPASLEGLTLRDGAALYELGHATLAPGAFLVVVPVGFASGLHGDVPVAAGTSLLYVPSLDLSGDVAIVDASGATRSHLAALAEPSTHHASEGRCAPWWPDDAPAGIGFDRADLATPGSANAVDGCQ